MGKYEKQWARNRRALWMDVLGGMCVDCRSTENLEFDVIIPEMNGDRHHKMDTSARMSYYHRQIKWDNLAIRCTKCNNKKSFHDKKYIEKLRLWVKTAKRKARLKWLRDNPGKAPF